MIALRRKPAVIDPTHRVVFYPSFGRRVSGGWELLIHGAVFREGVDDYRRRLFLGLLRRVLKAQPQDLEGEVFQDRIAGFLLREQPGRSLAIQFGDRQHTLPRRTQRNGHVRVAVRLEDDHVARLCPESGVQNCWLDFHAVLGGDVDSRFAGAAHLIPREGVSVISDIDDTLKHTGVGKRRMLLANTFFNDFVAIDGMAALMTQWAEAGAAFHYVSSSPWQLYEPLRQLLEDEGYPRGTFHLKHLRFRDPSLLRLFIARRLPKRRAIESILQAFPARRFILVGDSGEKDPEIYGLMARKYPQQVARIFIRNIPERPMGIQRSAKTFREVPGERWRIYRDAEEIAAELGEIAAA